MGSKHAPRPDAEAPHASDYPGSVIDHAFKGAIWPADVATWNEPRWVCEHRHLSTLDAERCARGRLDDELLMGSAITDTLPIDEWREDR